MIEEGSVGMSQGFFIDGSLGNFLKLRNGAHNSSLQNDKLCQGLESRDGVSIDAIDGVTLLTQGRTRRQT